MNCLAQNGSSSRLMVAREAGCSSACPLSNCVRSSSWSTAQQWFGDKLSVVYEKVIPKLRDEMDSRDRYSAKAQGIESVGESELAERHRIRLSYWASFGDFLRAKGSAFNIRRANKDHWFAFPIGRSGFVISATISTKKQRIGVELYIHRDADKSGFRGLMAQKESIEAEFGEPLDWQELPTKKASRIAVFRHGVDPSDEAQRQDLHGWMLQKMELFRKAFAARVKALSMMAGEPSDSAQ